MASSRAVSRTIMDLDELGVSIKRASKTAQQLSQSMKDKFADTLRPKITTWLENDTSSGRKSEKEFIDELKENYIRRTRFPKLGTNRETDWRMALESAAQELVPEYGQTVMETVTKKWLGRKKPRSPDPEFVLPKAYKWLQHLESHPPKDVNWFPKHAIEVTFKAFRLKGTLNSFKKYLCAQHRQKKLPKIMPHVDVAGVFRLRKLFSVDPTFLSTGQNMFSLSSCNTYSVFRLSLLTRSIYGQMLADLIPPKPQSRYAPPLFADCVFGMH